MSKRDQSGFSLIELILVMAISSSLLAIVFVGQRSLRSRAQFDAAVNRVVATVSQARTEATAGVNVVGTGDGTDVCPGGGVGQYVFAGVAWTADSALPRTPLKLDYYKALPGSESCVFDSRTLSLPSDIDVAVGAQPGGRVLFVRTNSGGLVVCPVTNLTADVRPMFTAGACSIGTITLNLSDADGHTSQVVIDSSGLAKRQN